MSLKLQYLTYKFFHLKRNKYQNIFLILNLETRVKEIKVNFTKCTNYNIQQLVTLLF